MWVLSNESRDDNAWEEGPAMERAEQILWAREPKTTVIAHVPTASGGGYILFSQLELQRRVGRNAPSYDPAA